MRHLVAGPIDAVMEDDYHNKRGTYTALKEALPCSPRKGFNAGKEMP